MSSELRPELRAHLDALAARAALKGANLWTVLDTAGLLYTEERRRTDRAHALSMAADHLEKMPVPLLLGSAYRDGSFTAHDMRRGVIAALRGRVDLAREGQA